MVVEVCSGQLNRAAQDAGSADKLDIKTYRALQHFSGSLSGSYIHTQSLSLKIKLIYGWSR